MKEITTLEVELNMLTEAVIESLQRIALDERIPDWVRIQAIQKKQEIMLTEEELHEETYA